MNTNIDSTKKTDYLKKMVSWGNSSHKLGYFYAGLQDINVYVEDTAKGSEPLYKAMIKNLFPDKNIRNIIPLGGRSEVVAACKSKKNIMKELYIIDGDLNLLYENNIKIKGLFSSKVYCIENYMVDEKAVATLLEETLAIEHEHALKMLNWSDFILSIKEAFIDLFIVYGVSHSLGSSEQTIKRFDPKTWINHKVKKGEYKNPNNEIIKKNKNELEEILKIQYGEAIYCDKYNFIKSRISKCSDAELLNYISGKNYLLPFVNNYLAAKGVPGGIMITKSMKYRLIKSSKHPELINLSNAFVDILKKGYYIPE